MVLTNRLNVARAVLAVSAAGAPCALAAQTFPEVAPALERNDPEYEPAPQFIGPLQLSVNSDVRIEYDDNIFALPDDPTSDGIAIVSLGAGLAHRKGAFTTRLDGAVTARRFFDETSQNSDAMRFQFGVSWEPSEAEALSLGASWQRAVEDRGDPESRLDTDLGPRLIDIAGVTAGYRRSRGKLLLDFKAEATELDAVDAIDDDRDFSVLGGTAKLGFRAGGRMFVTATTFLSLRDFRLAVDSTGFNRDATVYGARAGVEFVPGGLFEGNLSVGVFRNDPGDPRIEARTGLSLAGLLTYRPTRRMALVFNAFNGDVVTFRGGASGRTDTVLRLIWQHEIRHNLYSSVSAGYRESDFIESGVKEQTVIGSAELEYLVARNVSLVGRLNFGSRESDLPQEEFERFRGNFGVRLRF